MTLLPFVLSLVSPAEAADPTPVLVSAFQARNAESTQLSTLIESYVAQKLADHPDLKVIRVEDTPEFEDYDARTYMQSCPSGEIVGCTFVVGDRGKALWAVTGSVQALVKGTRVDIDIVDIANSRVAVSFRSELESGRDEAFAEGVARVLVAAIAGEVGKEEDIRKDGEEEEETDPKDNAAVAAELDALSKELGEFTTTIRRSNVTIQKPHLTEMDIAQKSTAEGSKPWERLGMTPGEYLKYKNSGIDLPTYLARSEGKRLQVILRLSGGFINGPVNGEYYGRYALDSTTTQPVDVYAAQSVESGSSAMGALEIAFGVHPMVDVGVRGGLAGGSYHYYWMREYSNGTEDQPFEDTEDNLNWFVGPRASVALFPTSNLRPTFGGGAYYMRGSSISDHILPPDELAQLDDEAGFGALPTWNVEVFIGGEARIANRLDFFVQIPVSFLVAGDRVQSQQDITVSSLDNLDEPKGALAIGVAATAGLQVRLGGAKPKAASNLDDADEP